MVKVIRTIKKDHFKLQVIQEWVANFPRYRESLGNARNSRHNRSELSIKITIQFYAME
jgi:hypothetical protein